MINLSEMLRKDKNTSLMVKLGSFLVPDQYHAESVLDFQEEAAYVTLPYFKQVAWSAETHEVAYVNLYSVALRKHPEKNDYFILHDGSGSEVVFWKKDHHIFPAKQSYEEVQEHQGMKDNDWLYKVQLRYSIESQMSSILSIQKDEFDTPESEKESLVDRVMGFRRTSTTFRPSFG